MSGQWPPEWGEPDWEDQETDQAMANSDGTVSDGTGEEDSQLAAVTAALAAFPMPVMPESVETRIAAALAAEAASRATGGAATRAPITTSSFEPDEHVLDRSRPRSVPPRRRRLQLRTAPAAASALVLVLLGVFGYALSQAGSSSNSSASSGAAVAAPSAAASASRPMFGAAGTEKSSALRPPARDLRPLSLGGKRPVFVVTLTGTSYQPGTVNEQLRQLDTALHGSSVNQNSGNGTVPSPSPSSPAFSASASGSGSAAPPATTAAAAPASTSPTYAPAPSLAGCVLKLTGGVPPRSVEYATYQDTPVYVIVGADRAWIVRVGCTASNPSVIATESLQG
jgi:hypothetical protein